MIDREGRRCSRSGGPLSPFLIAPSSSATTYLSLSLPLDPPQPLSLSLSFNLIRRRWCRKWSNWAAPHCTWNQGRPEVKKLSKSSQYCCHLLNVFVIMKFQKATAAVMWSRGRLKKRKPFIFSLTLHCSTPRQRWCGGAGEREREREREKKDKEMRGEARTIISGIYS
jgi:hypothetical protein